MRRVEAAVRKDLRLDLGDDLLALEQPRVIGMRVEPGGDDGTGAMEKVDIRPGLVGSARRRTVGSADGAG